MQKACRRVAVVHSFRVWGSFRVLVCLALVLVWASPTLAKRARFRSGVRNSPEKQRLSDKQLNQVLQSLRDKTGWVELYFDEDEFLVCPNPANYSGGSAAARQLLGEAIFGAQVFDLEVYNRSSAVTFARLAAPIDYKSMRTGEKICAYPLQLDFGDFQQLRGDPEALEAFDYGLVILHELAHGVWQLRDAENKEEEPGECESFVNRIRRDLDLPERLQYEARVRPGTLHVSTGTRLIAELAFGRTIEKAGQAKQERFRLQWEALAVGAVSKSKLGTQPELTAAFR